MKITQKNDYILLNSGKKGPRTAIFVGVHGNEICGILALKEVVKKITIDSGLAMFVYGNIKAIDKNIRFTEFNLNRAFNDSCFYNKKIKKTYEYKRAQVLKKYLSNIDLLLDIHSVSDKKSEPFIICEKNASDIIKSFSSRFKKVVSGLGVIQPGGIDGYMNSLGKIGICIECGFHKDKRAVSLAKKTIFDFLESSGNIKVSTSNNLNSNLRKYIKVSNLYITKSNNFTLSKEFFNFEMIKKGILIGIDGKTKIKTKKESLILFAHNRKKIGEEAFILGKFIDNKIAK
ncbi:MAG: succinylglutamate desuccinylase/aspartoacylase family protein [Candidatus Paceibacterota bacterium]